MKILQDLIAIENVQQRAIDIKKGFMPYTLAVEVDGAEKQALTILLNLSLSKPESKDWLDASRAVRYFSEPMNLAIAEQELQWVHTHNLKFPDCRVANQRILATPLYSDSPTLTSRSLKQSYGWAHNSAAYKHTIWLLNIFQWRGNVENILSLIRKGEELWQVLLADMGLPASAQIRLKELIDREIPEVQFPSEVNRYSKQVRIPWDGEYLSITPVVSHAIQQELAILSRQRDCSLRFKTMDYPHSASIGNLCGSLGGHMSLLNYPTGVRSNLNKTLEASLARTSRYFDDFQLTSNRTCDVLAHLAGFDQPGTHKARKHVRKYQLKIIRKQIARWLLPLIELRDNTATEPVSIEYEIDDQLAEQFLTINEDDFVTLATSLSQRINQALQNNRFAARFAYHPKLMQVLKTELIWVLTQLSSPAPEPSDIENAHQQYIYLSSIRVFDGAAISCPYLSGALSLTAVWGFVHRYQREFCESLSGEGEACTFKDFAIFIRNESIQTSAKLTEPSVLAKARQVSPVKRSTIIREDYSDLIFDLVITVESNLRLSDYQHQLKSALPTNFAGGALLQPEIDSGIEWLRTFPNQSDLFQTVKGLPSYGVWLAPHLIQPQSLLELEECLSDETLIPVANGFHLLESPKQRAHALTGLHAYAENNIALAKCVNPVEFRLNDKSLFFEQVFWSLETTKETILLKNKRN